MRIGYACLTVGVPNVNYKSCILRNATTSNLMNLIEHNLRVLDTVIDYNIENNIRMFRISSDIIPFGSHPVNTVNWQSVFSDTLLSIGKKALQNGIRLSMHPGQYTVLNSPNEEVVQRAILDLQYHCDVLDGLGLSPEHKLILHIGGIYGDKEAAMKRFVTNYKRLDESIKNRLIIENDDKSYTIDDVLWIAKQIDIPVVFDNLHHAIHHADNALDEIEIIQSVKETWKAKDGMQKIHYSQQALGKRVGSHSETVTLDTFMDFYLRLDRKDIDIMLEVKDKNHSALKCIHATMDQNPRHELEKAWHHYKYLVMEHNPDIYQVICQLLSDNEENMVLLFYRLIEEALTHEVVTKNAIIASKAIWDIFKKQASEKEKNTFNKEVLKIRKEQKILPMKRFLYKLSNHYQENCLLDSYYFKDLM
jgi:UV DNA damage endonuclease